MCLFTQFDHQVTQLVTLSSSHCRNASTGICLSCAEHRQMQLHSCSLISQREDKSISFPTNEWHIQKKKIVKELFFQLN